MSKSLYDLIGEQEFEVECPNCKAEFSISFNQIGHSVSCPHCAQQIQLNDTNSSMPSIKEAADSLEKTLNNL